MVANGYLNSENNTPAVVSYKFDSKTTQKMWMKNGLCHREDDLPAFISYNKNRNTECEIWLKNDNIHREDDKPAVKNYHYNSVNVEEERWFLNGVLSRKTGMDTSVYNENGILIKQYNDALMPDFENEMNRYYKSKTALKQDCTNKEYEDSENESEGSKIFYDSQGEVLFKQ